MDKILYTCNADYLGYKFPKRKWWDIRRKDRIAEFVLKDIFKNEEFTVLMRIVENYPQDYSIWIDEYYRSEIWTMLLRHALKQSHFEVLLVIDVSGEFFADILPNFAEDKNYLAVFTEHPKRYEAVMERIEMDSGLIGMVYTDYRDFTRYQRQICVEKRALVFWGNNKKEQEQNGRTVFYRFREKDLLIDFGKGQEHSHRIWGKRMEADYINLPVFLDNMVKNRYNSVVNEGLQQLGQLSYQQQNVYRSDKKNKLSEERKGIRKWKKRKIF